MFSELRLIHPLRAHSQTLEKLGFLSHRVRLYAQAMNNHALI